MGLPKGLTTVTTLSKILAGILFVLLPFVGFYLGMKYQTAISPKTVERTTTANVPAVSTPVKTPTTSPDPTANWKTYEDPSGYQIKYPETYFINVKNVLDATYVEISDTPSFRENEFALTVGILSSDDGNFQGNDDPSIPAILNKVGYDELSKRWGGELRGNFWGDPPWGYYQVAFPRKGTNKSRVVISVRIHNSDELPVSEYGTNNMSASSAKQILSTFKFIQ
ncbi:MAG: hypothetical protein ABIJ36_00065 [Patescibacteria group bacterium]